MNKKYIIGVGAALTLVMASVIGINQFAASKVSEAIDDYNQHSKVAKITGDVSANILTSSVSINNLSLLNDKGVATKGAIRIEGINFIDSNRRLSNDVAISYRDLTSDETSQSKDYSVSGIFRVQNNNQGDLTFTSNNKIVNKLFPEEHFSADIEMEFSDTQDLFDKINQLVSSPKAGKKALFKEMSFGLYLKAMQSQLGHVHLVLDNAALLQISLHQDMRVNNPEADGEAIEALYQARISEVRARLSPEGLPVFDNFIGKDVGTLDVSIEQKKGISLLEASFKSGSARNAGALKDYYDVNVR
jgi:hypothetical protein